MPKTTKHFCCVAQKQSLMLSQRMLLWVYTTLKIKVPQQYCTGSQPVCVNALFIFAGVCFIVGFFDDIDQECRWQWNGLTINKPLGTSARILGILLMFDLFIGYVWYQNNHVVSSALRFVFSPHKIVGVPGFKYRNSSDSLTQNCKLRKKTQGYFLNLGQIIKEQGEFLTQSYLQSFKNVLCLIPCRRFQYSESI